MSTETSRVCVECGRSLAQDQMISLNDTWVCAQCKPVFLQRLVEGATLPSGSSLWRRKKDLILSQGGSLPDLCLKCNAPAHSRLKRNLSWHPRWVYLLIIPGIVIYAIVAAIMRKRAIVHIGLCDAHRRRRKSILIGCWVAATGGLGLAIVGGDPALIGAGILLFLAALIVGAFGTRMIYASRIDSDTVWMRGTGEEFLKSLPEWRGI